jgi:hypothetical protein
MPEEGELEDVEIETEFTPSESIELNEEWVAWLQSEEPQVAIGGYSGDVNDLGDENVA